MRAILIIAKNTFTEIMRDRILYGLMLFGFFLIAISLALGQLSFAEQTRITTNFGFTAMHLSAVILSIFVGSTLVAREIEKKTIMTLLVRPIDRTQFIVGKAIGMMAIISVSILVIAAVLAVILYFMQIDLNWLYFVGMFGILLEAGILLSFTLFFGSFSSPILSVSFSLSVFFIGHWIDSLRYFAERSHTPGFREFSKVINSIFPNLEHLNWRTLFVYAEPILPSHIFWNTIYAHAWMVLLVTLSALILRSRDLG